MTNRVTSQTSAWKWLERGVHQRRWFLLRLTTPGKKFAQKMGPEIYKKHMKPAKQRGMEMKDAVPGKVVDVLGDGNCFYPAKATP